MKRVLSWRTLPFQVTIFTCLQFIVLTMIAMLVYPGGTPIDPSTQGYSFTRNFFSDLGRTVARGGRVNTPSMVLFVIALASAGLGLVLFFIAAPQFFGQTRLVRALSILGSIFGVISGLSYAGIALAPANLVGGLHLELVLMAFRSFLVVVVFYTAAIFLNAAYPKAYGGVYLAFAVLLAGYLWLLTNGPRPDSAEGVLIQAAGQKAIVYAAILCMVIQGYGVMRLAEGNNLGKRSQE